MSSRTSPRVEAYLARKGEINEDDPAWVSIRQDSSGVVFYSILLPSFLVILVLSRHIPRRFWVHRDAIVLLVHSSFINFESCSNRPSLARLPRPLYRDESAACCCTYCSLSVSLPDSRVLGAVFCLTRECCCLLQHVAISFLTSLGIRQSAGPQAKPNHDFHGTFCLRMNTTSRFKIKG